MSAATPEEAARQGTLERFVHVIGVVVRGDSAIVAQLMNDVPRYEIDTVECSREAGRRVAGSSGNQNGGYLPTGDGRGTVVVWDEAPADAVAARFDYDGREQLVPVEQGCALAVFDDVPEGDQWVPRLAAWIDAAGEHTQIPEPPWSMRDYYAERLRRFHER